MNSNWSYSLETLNSGRNWWYFVLCDLEIWWMTLENNRAPLLYYIKLCASFQIHRWSQTWVTVRKRHDVQFSCAIYQPLLAPHWRVHQCLLTSRFIAPSIPWGVSAPGGKMWKQLLKDRTFLIIHRFLPLKVPLLYIYFSKSTAYNIFQFKKMFWIWWKVLDTIILWQDVGPCCEQTHAAFELGLSLDQGQGVYSGWSDVVVSSQLRLCHTCIIDVMLNSSQNW